MSIEMTSLTEMEMAIQHYEDLIADLEANPHPATEGDWPLPSSEERIKTAQAKLADARQTKAKYLKAEEELFAAMARAIIKLSMGDE